MNWKKLTISIIAINIVAWLMLEFWIHRYSGGVAEYGAGFLVFFQLGGYYIIAVNSMTKKKEEITVHPKDCKEHDWQKSGYTEEACIICKATRRTE